MLAYANLESVPPEKRNEVRNALLRYCELDTLAMVENRGQLFNLQFDKNETGRISV